MKLIVFGATGKTGIEIVKQGLADQHQVTAFVRTPSKMSFEHDSLRLVEGDVLDLTAVKHAIQGHEAVICSLGTSDLGKTMVRSAGTANIIKAMQEAQIKRLIVISAMGVGESWSTLSFVNKLFFATLLRNTRMDHEEQEKLVKQSDLDWTIVRPSGLSDTPRTGVYEVGEDIHAQTSTIARADVADLVIKDLDNNTLIRKCVTITN